MGYWLLIGGGVLVTLILAVIVGLVFSKLYKRTTKKRAFVRTGSGGQKVVKDGGAIIIPVLHETTDVNMETLRLVVTRAQKDALITKDKLRVDVKAEFYVRVKPEADAIATAAQTLGDKTMHPEQLRDLIEGKFVDALRSVAAGMEMNELHENRADFVQKVQNTLNEDLNKNGLELEAVSLTGLDQTSFEFFDGTNAFDAEGLKKLTEITELRRKERNDIERQTQVAIEQRDLDTKQKSLEIKKQEAEAIAERDREIAEKQAQESKASELARIHAEQETEEARIAKDKAVREREIERDKALEEQRIAQTKAIEAANIAKQKDIESAEIGKRKTLELAEQDRAIEVAEKSELQSKAKAEAERARAEAVTEEQAVLTAEATAQAERAARVAVINERAVAEREAAKVLVKAEADRKAAEDRATAIKVEAEAEANRVTTIAHAKAKDYEVEAKGKEALNAALNKIPQEERELAIKKALIVAMPSIVEQLAKPIGHIDSIRVLDMRGSGMDTVKNVIDGKVVEEKGSTGGASRSGNLPQQVVDGLIDYRTRMPLLEKLFREVGVEFDEGLAGLVKGLDNAGLSLGGEADETTSSSKPTTARSTPKKSGKSTA